MEELGLDGAMLPWFLLVMFLYLPFAICLSLVLAGLAVSDYGLSVLQAYVSVLLGFLFSLCTQVCRHSWETSSLVVVFVYVALGSQASPQSWEVSYLPVPPGYGAL